MSSQSQPRLDGIVNPIPLQSKKTFTDGRIVIIGQKIKRQKQKRADYLLRYTRDFMIAVVEAKAAYKLPTDGLGQAKEYAEILGLKFAYSTNGHGIIEFDYITGREREIESFPSPKELWERLQPSQKLGGDLEKRLLTPSYIQTGKTPRYYQEIAINRTVQAIFQGKPRILLTARPSFHSSVVNRKRLDLHINMCDK
jgi:type I restriction enzyme R subunit